MAFGPADRDGTNQNKDRTWKGPSVKLWVTAPAATFPLSPVHQTGITIINVKIVALVCAFTVVMRLTVERHHAEEPPLPIIHADAYGSAERLDLFTVQSQSPPGFGRGDPLLRCCCSVGL